MKKNELVTKIATKTLITVNSDQKLSEVRDVLKQYEIHHVPVIEGEKLVGMISSTDIMSLTFDAYGTDERAQDAVLDHQFQLTDVMQKDVETISEKASVRDAAELLAEGRFHSVPVVGEDGKLVGLVTSTDLIRYLLEQY